MIEKGNENRVLARHAATQGMVLLKNEGHMLPFRGEPTKVAVFGIGQIHMFKGGTGSGDVYNHATISILQGLQESPHFVTDESLATKYHEWAKLHPAVTEYTICKTASYEEMPIDPSDLHRAADENEAAVVVISHTSGEDSDRKLAKGDYYLSDGEAEMLRRVHQAFSKTVVLLNTCGIVDLKDVEPYCEALLYVSMPGQEGGHAVADILSGEVTPSGKLTDTWAVNWREYPSSPFFGAIRRNGNWNYKTHGLTADAGVEQTVVEYQEGIYNGYRYFDTFGVPVMYPFGYGLSYTTFALQCTDFAYEHGTVIVKVRVQNTGDLYAGKEVVQVYVSAPDGRMDKPFKELKGFTKTKELAPQEATEVKINIAVAQLGSYDETHSAWVLEAGYYDLYVGSNLQDANALGSLHIAQEIRLTQNRSLATRRHPFPVLSKMVDGITRTEPDRSLLPVCEIDIADFETKKHVYSTPSTRKAVQTNGTLRWENIMDGSATLQDIVSQMDVQTLAELVCGLGLDIIKMNENFVIGDLENGLVPGCAGMTHENETFDIPAMVLADGPAGLRLHPDVKDENGQVVMHQHCTAYPVGTLLASSWDEELLYQVGRSVGEEMKLFHVDLWLAPGMNIHRNPLCGRNFEYYSEDPLLTGRMAAAITKGVQSHGVGVSIKHMAVNNQEELRANSDSRLDERTLREIYLKGFEIAITEAQPWAIMTSYNDINGIPAADNYDLCTGFAKDECGHEGLIMTDWGGGLALSPIAIAAGNDMIQPGGRDPIRSIVAWCDGGELRSKGEAHVTVRLTRAMLEDCATRCLGVLKKARGYSSER